MTKKMLIDAAHPEETRVVVTNGSRVEEFDFESEGRRQLRGNIYLARVTRVEPSLQAAFVEYGGNRHGFLAFGEIHPDYYQLPYEDRQKLVAELEAAAVANRARSEEEDDDDLDDDTAKADASAPAVDSNGDDALDDDHDDDDDTAASEELDADSDEDSESDRSAARDTGSDAEDDDHDSADTGSVQPFSTARLLRKYKIQEVIKRRQILLVQVVKEERGNKGAALTTYLSLAGRYCVLMPNTARGGGISRKITSGADRKRLKKIVAELDVPLGMGLIVRTAGSKRTRTELKRDYDYLMRLWESVREATLNSVAPALIHEESNLVKRSVRDLYDKDIESIIVEGEAAYREAKDFVRMLMPSHAKKVQPHRENSPIYLHYGIETQLAEIYAPTVQLRSGGYLVINQTEALVAIDVNSGRATRERNVENTAVKTNLEAAEEACRQFRLRDLAGLIVIDFIDMDESKNVRAVEKRLRDCLKNDRARIQTGKISQFGLLEMSRQRRRSSVLEGSHDTCHLCDGRGVVRTVDSAALHTMRAIEAEVMTGKASVLRVRVATSVSVFLLNDKRGWLSAIEERFAVRVLIEGDAALIPPSLVIDRVEMRGPDDPMPKIAPPVILEDPEPDVPDDADEDDLDDLRSDEDDEDAVKSERPDGGRRKRRRRRGRRSEGDADTRTATDDDADAADAADTADAGAKETDTGRSATARTGDEEEGDKPKRRRRRGRRGGRGRRPDGAATGMEVIAVDGEELASDAPSDLDGPADLTDETPNDDDPETPEAPEAQDEDAEASAPAPRRRRRTRKAKSPEDASASAETDAADVADAASEEGPASARVANVEPVETTAETDEASETASELAASSTADLSQTKPRPKRKPAATARSAPARADAEVDADSDVALAEEEAATTTTEADPGAALDPDAAARRKRWQDRLKSWLNN